MGEYFESFPEEITKWEIIRGMVDLHLDDAQPVQNKKIPSVQLLPRQDVMRYGWIPKMEQVIYTKCRECKLVFKPWDILSHKSCSGRSIPTIPHSSKKKVHNKGNLKIPSSTLRKQAVKESASPSISNPAASVPVSTPSPAVASNSAANSASTPAKAVTKMVVDDITSSQPIKTTTTATAATVSKSQLAVSTSGSSKPHVAHSQKSHHTSWPSRTETGGSNSGSSSSHSHHHGHGHSHHHHHSSGSSHSNHGRTSSSSSSSSRYKKSKKSNSSCRVAVKHFDPDVHCGVVVSGKGPCTRSVTCSNHRIQLRKLVPGRSKDILELIAEKKTSKEQAPSPNGGVPEEKDSFSQSTTCVPLVEASASTNEPDKSKAATFPKPNDIPSCPRQTSLYTSDKNENTTEMESKAVKDEVKAKEEDKSGFMPMSPISVVAPVPDWKMDKNDYYLYLLKCTVPDNDLKTEDDVKVPIATTASVLVPIVNSSVKFYRSHSKPVTLPSHYLPTYNTRKIGGAILISNPHVDSQRQEILMAINKHKMMNNTHGFRLNNHANHVNHVNNHRPNILKVRSVNKVNCKRMATEKLNASENKQSRLHPNVNGYILHSDISESAEAPQFNSNNCLQQALLNLN